MSLKYLRTIAAIAAMTAFVPTCALAQPSIGWSFATNTPSAFLGPAPETGYFQMGGHALVEIAGTEYLYIIGGNVNQAGQATYSAAGDSPYIYYAALDSNGDPGTWTQATLVLPEVATGEPGWTYIEQSVASINGRIYIFGGNNNGAPPQRNSITILEPSATGDITAIADTVVPPAGEVDAIFNMVAVDAVNNRIYSLNGGPSTAIVVRNVNPTTGALSASTAAGTLTTAVRQTPMLVHDGYLYVIAGRGATMQSAIQYAPINAGDGTLGAFQTATGVLPTVFADGGAVSFNNTIYVIAGTRNSNADTQNRVFRAVMGASGDITSWAEDNLFPIPSQAQQSTFDTATTPATIGPRRTGAVAGANAIYLVGGRYDAARVSSQVAVGKVLPAVLSASGWDLYE